MLILIKLHTHTHTTQNCFKALLDFVWDYLGEPASEGKTNLDLLQQEVVSGSGISGPYANLHLDPDT